MAKAKIDQKLKGPKSPYSDDALHDASGRELDAWVASELDGFRGVSKRQDGSYEGSKGGRRPIPEYRTTAEVKRLANQLTDGRRLVLSFNGKTVSIDDAGPDMCELANRALILESMKKRGAI